MKIKQLITIISAATLISCAPQPALAKEPQVSKEDFFAPRPMNLQSKL